jgi:hypothetical protein
MMAFFDDVLRNLNKYLIIHRSGYYRKGKKALVTMLRFDKEAICHSKRVSFMMEDICKDDMLRVANHNGVTVAHILAYNRGITKNPDILKLQDINGVSVAHVIVESAFTSARGAILSRNNERANEAIDIIYYLLEHEDILRLRNSTGSTVAHYMATLDANLVNAMSAEIRSLENADISVSELSELNILRSSLRSKWQIYRGAFEKKKREAKSKTKELCDVVSY